MGQCPNNGQNPLAAFVFTSNQSFVQTSVPACTGTPVPVPVCSEPYGTYQDINPYYYRMHCYQSGILIFTITPHNLSDDYDWQLFDITGKNPNNIYTDVSMFVRCNWSGNTGKTGSSINSSQLSSCEGSSTPNFTSPPYLTEGHDYLLLVSHFTASNQSGYNLSFYGDSILTQAITPLPRVKGQIFLDHNSNSTKDTLEPYKANVKVQLSNGNYTFTDNNGYYQIQADSIGTNTLTVTPPTGYNALPSTVTYNFTTYDTTVTKDIALQPNVVLDSVAINVIPMVMNAVQGGSMPYWIQYSNAGTTVLSPTVSLAYNNYLLAYDSCTDANAVATANGIVTGELNMQPSKTNNLISYFTIKPSANIGDTLTTVYNISTANTSQTDSFYMIIEGGIAPANGQRATPSLTQAQVAAGKDIVYTIGFKNTGNDTAYNVVITDTLSNLLQANTLQMVASSHTCRTTVKGNLVTFELLNINLTKVATNNLKSMGFVSFKVKPKTTLVAGNIITNKANTYYNYRAAQSSTSTTIIKGILPVKIMMFEASLTPQKEGLRNWSVLNKWQTATEINVSHFNIQRSINGKEFITIGKVNAGKSNYEFIDNKLPITNEKLTLNYRLEIVDKDGSKTYSDIKRVTLNEKQDTRNIIIYPNPTKTTVNIECKNAKELLVTDYLGKIVMSKKIVNNQYSTINVQQYSKGLYFVKLVLNNGEIKIEKLIVE